MPENDDNPWYRSLLAGIGALLGVAILVGGVISLVTLGAVNVSGIGDSSSSPVAEQTLYIPKHEDRSHDPRDKDLTLSDLNGGRNPQASASAQPGESPSPTKDAKKNKKQPSVISLSASPTTVQQMEQIYLSGTYPGGEGATLQVQRLEGGSWNNFPTSASVSGGTFSTYVMTGQQGDNKFRVVDTDSGKKSNDVNVTVK
ncbi:MAG TPA: hypothetical protein VF165_15010 [Nocardioidaceae bacterium]